MKIKSYIYATLTICLCSISSVFAQEKLTLQEAISIALQNNYDIKLVKNEVEIAKNNSNLGNAGMLPIVTGDFSTGGSRQNTVQTQASGTERRINGARNSNMAYGFGINWTVFDGFSMFANRERLKTLEEQGEKNVNTQILNTITEVLTAYYNMAKQQQLVVAADSTIDVSALRLRIADSKLKIGRGSKLDVVAAQVDYNTDTSTYLQQKNLLNNYMVTLNRLLARDITTKFSVDNIFDIDASLNYTTLASQLEQLNPALQSAILNQRVAELSLKQVQGNRYPQISLNSGYDFNKSESPTGFNTQFRARGFSYGLTASINIFNGFLQRQNERNAKVNISTAKTQVEQTKQNLVAQLTEAYQNYTTFLELVKLEQGNVNLANQNLDITLEKYRLGNITPLELREAQRNAINANNRYLEIKYQAKLSEIYLKQISGTLNL
ncbi:TolC family protein [Pedobacter chitinilyticus]|uniref:TolC family protein n=1 Tax=Pedobacter chitinilyticus TaxID=2233776 RepID=A0A443YPD3_9SPHI|nr:TolC family protein [Pedobacter chitinilyticus]RWU05585.1 TolC family protein [Pedobacter chitinilyticus]